MCCRELAAVDMDLLQKTTMDQDEVSELAPHFTHTFEALLAVMTLQEKKLQERAERDAKAAAHTASTTTSNTTTSQKRTRSTSPGPVPGKRPKKEAHTEMRAQPTTPDQPTSPVDPDHTSSSLESKAEPDSQKLLEDFLRDTLRALMKDVRVIQWQRSGHKVEIAKTYPSPGFVKI